jgi:hypothetical protein
LPRAKADAWDQRTTFSFSGPVEIPGQVLPAGTYVFKLMDSNTSRNVVAVYNKNEDHCYGIFLAVPDYRLRPAGRSIITFEERAAGAPEAVRAWFYPGENYGHEFVYPKVRASQLAQTNNQPVASMPNETATENTQSNVNTLRQAPLKAQQPNQQESEMATAFPPQSTTPAKTAPPASRMPSSLPQTASVLPLVGLAGLLSLGMAGLVGVVRAGLK